MNRIVYILKRVIIIAPLVVICVLASFFVFGLMPISDTSPSEFNRARNLWRENGFEHYRLVARWHYEIVGGCYEDIEVLNERIVKVHESDCESFIMEPVSGIFGLFDDRLGTDELRAPAGNACQYWLVKGRFHREYGYPIHITTELTNVEKRGEGRGFGGVFSCLLVNPVGLTAEVLSIERLE